MTPALERAKVVPFLGTRRCTSGAPLSGVAAQILNCRCPLWVISGHRDQLKECPLYPRKRTLLRAIGMSALCQKQTKCTATKMASVRSHHRWSTGSRRRSAIGGQIQLLVLHQGPVKPLAERPSRRQIGKAPPKIALTSRKSPASMSRLNLPEFYETQ